MTLDYYDQVDVDEWLEKLEFWHDPFPTPVLEKINGITVVRDDLIGVGSKARFADYLVKTTLQDEIVYTGATPVGWGPISLAYLCQKYKKTAVVFAAKRNEPTWHQKEAMKYGAKFIWLNMGMLNVCKARGKAYVAENPENRIEIPIGLEHWSVLGSIVKVARNLNINPKEIWTVGSSGTLNRGLQLAFPDAKSNVVQTGHSMSEREIGNATRYISPYKFDKKTKSPPPFESALEYDAKCWEFIEKHASKKSSTLFWNVAG